MHQLRPTIRPKRTPPLRIHSPQSNMHFSSLCVTIPMAATVIAVLLIAGCDGRRTSTVRDPDTFGRPRDVLNDGCNFRDNGTAGVCRELSDCGGAIVEMRSKRKLMPTSCGFVGKSPIVCCLAPSSSATSGGLKERPSRRECASYQSLLPASSAQRQRRAETGFSKINVVGGVRTRPAEFPHMAALGWSDSTTNGSSSPRSVTWKCGGTLISDQFVVTAAHCVRRSAPDVVRIGVHDLLDANAQSEHRIGAITVHPGYKASRAYNDIALVRLAESILLSRTTRPACLWQTAADPDTTVLATGFGLTEFGGSPSNQLLKVQLALVATAECSAQYTNVRTLPQGVADTQLCAGDATGRRDTCQGDSGGPLQTLVDRQHHVVGVTSFGRGCATSAPGVYTRISAFVPWIEGIVWPVAK